MGGRAANTQLSVPSFRVTKTGAEIKKAVLETIVRIETGIAKSKETIAEICKHRELDAADFLKVQDEDDIVRFSNSYSVGLEKVQSDVGGKSALQKLQADINTINAETAAIQHFFQEKINYGIIAAHIEVDRKFDLSYHELLTYGFR